MSRVKVSGIKATLTGIKNRHRQVCAKVMLDVDSQVVLGTPVDTGRARGNWLPTLNQPARYSIPATDKSGSGALAKAQALANKLPYLPRIFISNNLTYIERLNQGHSKQAPSMFVNTAVNNVAGKNK